MTSCGLAILDYSRKAGVSRFHEQSAAAFIEERSRQQAAEMRNLEKDATTVAAPRYSTHVGALCYAAAA